MLYSIKGGCQHLDYDSSLEGTFWWKFNKIKHRMNFPKLILFKTSSSLAFESSLAGMKTQTERAVANACKCVMPVKCN